MWSTHRGQTIQSGGRMVTAWVAAWKQTFQLLLRVLPLSVFLFPFFNCLFVFNFSYYDMCSNISKASIGILQTQTFWKLISVCIQQWRTVTKYIYLSYHVLLPLAWQSGRERLRFPVQGGREDSHALTWSHGRCCAVFRTPAMKCTPYP